VRSDSAGEFIIRTNRFGTLRLNAGSIGYRSSTSEVFIVSQRELVLVKLFVSPTQPVLVPLGIAARLRPETFAITDRGGFAYRRERGIGGSFVGPEEMSRRPEASLGEVFRRMDGVVVNGSAAAPAIALRTPGKSSVASCVPTVLLNGARLVTPTVDSTIAALPLSRVFGVEVYSTPADLPAVFADIAGECGLVGVWLKNESR